MSQQYDDYLVEHIGNVCKSMNWLMSKPDIVSLAKPGIDDDIWMNDLDNHDKSKYTPIEYSAYDDYFYGKEGRDEDDIAVIDSAFDYAWLHHIHHNPHHWQYWVLYGDDTGMKALEMPGRYILEMIADWWSFSWKNENLYEIFDWYDKHKEKMLLHERTRDIVEKILLLMRKYLDEEKGSVHSLS